LIYYADRSFIRVDSIESQLAYESEGRFRYLILSKKEQDKDLVAYNTPRFHVDAVSGYLLVNLDKRLDRACEKSGSPSGESMQCR